MKNLKLVLGVLFMSTLSVTAFSQTRSGSEGTSSGKPAKEQANGKEHDHDHDHDHNGGKGNNGKGHAYGKNKGDMSGREFGQQRSEEARNKDKGKDKDKKDKKPAQQQPAGTTPSGSTGTSGRDGK